MKRNWEMKSFNPSIYNYNHLSNKIKCLSCLFNRVSSEEGIMNLPYRFEMLISNFHAQFR